MLSWRVRFLRSLLVSAVVISLAQPIKGGTQTDQGRLIAQRDAIENWPAYAAANKISGWFDDNSVPVCLWTGVTCSPEGRIEQMALQCPNCPLKAEGTVAPDTAGIATLKTLNLQQQRLSGTLPPEFGAPGAFPSLFNLLLQQNQLTGMIPEEWSQAGTFPNMSLLTLHFNNLTGNLPEPDSWPQLRVLRLQHNQLSGTLPASWASSLPGLQIAGLHENQLQGPLPAQWAVGGAFSFLEELYLQGNQLTGGLPAFDANDAGGSAVLPKLRILDLSFNPLGGTLPPELGGGGGAVAPDLQLLYLREADLNGTLPIDWGTGGGLQKLRQLWIDGNDLSGTIPAEWAALPALQHVYVKPGNPRLCGPLPPNATFQLCDARGSSECSMPAALDGPECGGVQLVFSVEVRGQYIVPFTSPKAAVIARVLRDRYFRSAQPADITVTALNTFTYLAYDSSFSESSGTGASAGSGSSSGARRLLQRLWGGPGRGLLQQEKSGAELKIVVETNRFNAPSEMKAFEEGVNSGSMAADFTLAGVDTESVELLLPPFIQD